MALQLKTLLFFRCRKKEGDLTNALTQWRNIESALISKDAEYSKLLSENRTLSGGFSDLQNQLENVRMSTNRSHGAHKGLTFQYFCNGDLCVCRWRVFCQTQRTS